MADRTEILATIDSVYRSRIAGDKAALQAHFAPGAQIQLAGNLPPMPGLATGPTEAASTISALIDAFVFHDHEVLDAIVEGDKAAVRTRITVSRPGGGPVSTELYDLWTFDADGRPTSVVQFVDTALVARMMGEP